MGLSCAWRDYRVMSQEHTHLTPNQETEVVGEDTHTKTRFSASTETPKDVLRFPLIAARVKGAKRTCTPIVIHDQEELDANAVLAATLEEGLIIMPVPEELQPRTEAEQLRHILDHSADLTPQDAVSGDPQQSKSWTNLEALLSTIE